MRMQSQHEIYIDELRLFATEGERFTKEQGNDLNERILLLSDDLKMVLRHIQELEIEIAKLPPAKWQDRIINMESELNEMRVFMQLKPSHFPRKPWVFDKHRPTPQVEP